MATAFHIHTTGMILPRQNHFAERCFRGEKDPCKWLAEGLICPSFAGHLPGYFIASIFSHFFL